MLVICTGAFCDTVPHSHSVVRYDNGYEYVLYCRRFPDIRKSVDMHEQNQGF